MITGIEGQFGSGKTSTAVKIAERAGPRALVLTNIRVNTQAKPNWLVFGDDELMEMLRFANAVNDGERLAFCKPRNDAPFPYYARGKFTHILILLDEAGASMNNRAWKDFDVAMVEYVNQNRKMRTDIFLVTADGQQVESSLRRFVEQWYYAKPLLPFGFFKDVKLVRCMIKDSEGKPKMLSYLGRDANGDWVVKEKPQDFFVFWYWQPTTWRLYDDWHKNIKDPEKYSLESRSLQLLSEHFARKSLVEQGLVMTGKVQESIERSESLALAAQRLGAASQGKRYRERRKELDF